MNWCEVGYSDAGRGQQVFRAAAFRQRKDEHLSDQVLMDQLAHRRERALERLYDRHSRAVYSLLLRITRQPAAAEELLQEVFLRLWRNAPSYRASRGSLGPWLATLARNMAIDHLRSKSEKQRKRENLVEILPEQVVPAGTEERLDLQRRAARVRHLIEALPEAQRRALELAYFEGMTQSEIAGALNEPLGTVKTWIRNALLRLRRGMEAAS